MRSLLNSEAHFELSTTPALKARIRMDNKVRDKAVVEKNIRLILQTSTE